MLERDLFEQYRLSPLRFIKYRGLQAFTDEQGNIYILMPAKYLDERELMECRDMSEFLQIQLMENKFASIQTTVHKELISKVNGEQIVLYKAPHSDKQVRDFSGEQLAYFHINGNQFPYQPQSASRLRSWNTLWANRLDQLEKWWSEKMKGSPTNEFEENFFESFSYFLGLTENAIQYVTDCMWEDLLYETYVGTICFVKWTRKLSTREILFPNDLVYDHFTRDLAEWIRYEMEVGTSKDQIIQFLNEYSKVIPISTTSKRLLFGRLLFPLSYFEMVEGYYSSRSEEVKMKYERDFLDYNQNIESYLNELFNLFMNMSDSQKERNDLWQMGWINRSFPAYKQ